MKVTPQITGLASMTNHPLYNVWYDMIRRCTNPNRDNYKYYGGRGIKVCERWLNSFDNFVSDMGDRPDGYELDRINNEGNYTPQNCKWVTHRDQTLNRRGHAKTGVKGVYVNQGKYQAGLRRFGRYIHLGTFKSLSEAAKAVESYV